jgi:hypothetical protein
MKVSEFNITIWQAYVYPIILANKGYLGSQGAFHVNSRPFANDHENISKYLILETKTHVKVDYKLHIFEAML